jgi:hypothetical protein
MCDWYDSSPDFLNSESRKARKNYHCIECGFTINPGDKYQYIFGKWGGDVTVYRRCAFCEAACESLRTLDDYNGCYGGLWEEYENFAFDDCDLPFWLIEHKDLHLGRC